MEESRDDILVFDLDGKRLSLELSDVETVLESEDIFFLPNTKPPVMGIITHRGEPITVVDAGRFFRVSLSAEKPHTIIILRKNGNSIGLCIGNRKPTFLWKKELKDLRTLKANQKYIHSTIEGNGMRFELINWRDIYDETRRVLSTRGTTEEGAHS